MARDSRLIDHGDDMFRGTCAPRYLQDELTGADGFGQVLFGCVCKEKSPFDYM
jgi:hypothetical protein